MARFQLTRPFFLRRQSSKQSHTTTDSRRPSTAAASTSSPSTSSVAETRSSSIFRRPRKSSSQAKLREKAAVQGADIPEAVAEQRESVLVFPAAVEKTGHSSTEELNTPSEGAPRTSGSVTLGGDRRPSQLDLDKSVSPSIDEVKDGEVNQEPNLPPALVVQQATPAEDLENPISPGAVDETGDEQGTAAQPSNESSRSVSPRTSKPDLAIDTDDRIVKTEVEVPAKKPTAGLDTEDSLLRTSRVLDYLTPGVTNMASMLQRKIWVRRPGASATLVQIKEDDLVDDVRDMILRKYANSLGKTFDAPDMLLRILMPSENGTPQKNERILGPEEPMCRTIDAYFPNGQTVDDALVIDVPQKRTPRASPRVYAHQVGYPPNMEDYRPVETGTDYFPPMPAIVHPNMPAQTSTSRDGRPAGGHGSEASDHQRSISVLSTGQLPPLPSPGGTRRHPHRPKFNRQHTSSPTIVQHHSGQGAVAVPPTSNLAPNMQFQHRLATRPRKDSSASEQPHVGANGVPAAPPLPTPPAPEAAAKPSTPSTPRDAAVISPMAAQRSARPRKHRKPTPEKPNARNRRDRNTSSDSPHPGPISNMLDASIPPINVLIVEDNIINLRILEGLMKRLKVRWQTAMNGQIAVDKWRGGGFHLVLMDIQMPVMNGLQATKEIRRLEKVNGIGVFSSSAPSSPAERRNGKPATNGDQPDGDANDSKKKSDPAADKLPANEGFFKSPVIIVALTASSLQSDRHEALAAGCNDFLTKPVNFVWLERKVKEWGCMQALIDFDGWRRWKDYAAKEDAGKSEEQKRKEAEDEEKQKRKMEKLAILQERQRAKKEADEAKKRAKRESMGGGGAGEKPKVVEQTDEGPVEEEKPREVEQREQQVENGVQSGTPGEDVPVVEMGPTAGPEPAPLDKGGEGAE